MERWDDQLREDHQALEAQVGALEAALKIDVAASERRTALRWIVRTLGPALGLHLKREEETLFPALEELSGKETSAIEILKEQHRELRLALKNLATLLENPGPMDWEGIAVAGREIVDLLEDHERKEDQLLINVLDSSLKPQELMALARGFQKATWKAYSEQL